jgi:hypothetical protein
LKREESKEVKRETGRREEEEEEKAAGNRSKTTERETAKERKTVFNV